MRFVSVIGALVLSACGARIKALKSMSAPQDARVPPALSWSPLAKSFGSENVGLASSTTTFTLSNPDPERATGCAKATLTDSTNFTIVTDDCGAFDLAAGDSCAVVVQANPMSAGTFTTTLSRTCTFGGTFSTTANAIAVTGVTGNVSVAALYPTNGANWNDYVRNYGGGTSAYTRNDTACAGTELGNAQCLHGGEMRKAAVTGFSSCAGLSATDSLGAFDWECILVGGIATMVSKGLKTGKGLRDLIDSGGTAFRSESLTVNKLGCSSPVAQSSPAIWWSNPVAPLPDNSLATDSVSVLTGTSTIYTLAASRDTMGYNLNAPKIGIVTLGSSILSAQGSIALNCDDGGRANGTPNNSAVLCEPGMSYLWIETDIDGKSSNNMYNSYGGTGGSYFVRVHRSTMYNGTGFQMDSLRSSLYDENASVGMANSGTAAMLPWYSSYNTFRDLKIANPAGIGIWFWESSNNNVFQRVSVSNSNLGSSESIRFEGGTDGNSQENVLVETAVMGGNFGGVEIADSSAQNTLHGLTVLNHAGTGATVAGNGNALTNFVIANNGSAGVSLSGNSNLVADAASAHNAGNAFETTGTAGSNLFRSTLYRGSTSTCSNGGSGGGNELDNSCDYDPSLSSTMSAVDLTSAFVGMVTGDDSVNASDANGAAAYSTTMDWLKFDSFFRGWGKDGSAFPNSDDRGACTTGTCRIWDASLSASDTYLREINGAFTPGAACPASVDGSNSANTVTDGASRTYLLHAVEVDGDRIGNDNGLCESGEACVYSPNLGADQGSGDPSPVPCTFTDGTISGVTMYGRSTVGTNGFTSAIATNDDDGEFDSQDLPAWLTRTGESGTVYLGNWGATGITTGYFRFQVPTAIPPGATIDLANLKFYGADNGYWDSSHALVLSADLSGNAVQPNGTEDFPSGATQHSLATTTVRWPSSGGLTWNTGVWNTTPDLSAIIQEIVDAEGGLAAGSYLQFWVQGQDPGHDSEAGVEDLSTGGGHPTNLTVTWH